MQKILPIEQLDTVRQYMDDYMVKHIKNGQFGKFECHLRANLISFKWINIQDLSADPIRLIIYYSNEHLFIFCKGKNCIQKVEQLIAGEISGASNERIIYIFFAGLIKNDIDVLEKLEEQITSIEDDLLTSSKKECAEEIISFRRNLLILKKYYEQLNYIFDGLFENENELMSAEYHRYIGILGSRIDRLFSNVLNLRDYVTQVREAYQAQIDIEQNNLMKIFTVVTAVFLPLSLIAGWYGMNFQMPELAWKYGYIFVIFLSSFVVLISIIIFKKKKWF